MMADRMDNDNHSETHTANKLAKYGRNIELSDELSILGTNLELCMLTIDNAVTNLVNSLNSS